MKSTQKLYASLLFLPNIRVLDLSNQYDLQWKAIITLLLQKNRLDSLKLRIFAFSSLNRK